MTQPIIPTKLGRKIIYTDQPFITRENLIDVLTKAKNEHMSNVADIQFLLKYEKGVQPLNRTKTVRADIDICDVDNIANQITEFKLGYDWGYPITLVQRGVTDSGSNVEPEAIARLNEYYEIAGNRGHQQELARYVEITGIGYTYVDINTEYVDGESPFTHDVLDPEFTFVVRSTYYTDKRIVMGVTFTDKNIDGETIYTCFTPSSRFVVRQLKNIEEYSNPLGIIPIVEWIRAYDRMGCFERQIPEMDALNLLNSDFLNDVDQNTQAIWHTNDVDFKVIEIKNEDGTTTKKVQKPANGQWLQTYTSADGKTPFITPLTITYDYGGILNNIVTKRQMILAKCDVPQRNDNSGGSTGIAMSDASGWSAAEASASKKENIQDMCKTAELRVVFRAISKCGNIESDNPINGLRLIDVKPYIKRQKSYEMTVKTNALATMLSHGIHGLHAIKAINFFDDPAQVWEDSKERIEEFQDSQIKSDTSTSESEGSDNIIDQVNNSPNIDGMYVEEVEEVEQNPNN